MQVYFVADPKYVFSVSRFNSLTKKFESLDITAETLKHQFDDYYRKLNNDPRLSLMRIKEEYNKTGYLDIDKLERNILFNEYQVLEVYQGYLMELDINEYFDYNLSHKKMANIKQGMMEEKMEFETMSNDVFQNGEMMNGQ